MNKSSKMYKKFKEAKPWREHTNPTQLMKYHSAPSYTIYELMYFGLSVPCAAQKSTV